MTIELGKKRAVHSLDGQSQQLSHRNNTSIKMKKAKAMWVADKTVPCKTRILAMQGND